MKAGRAVGAACCTVVAEAGRVHDVDAAFLRTTPSLSETVSPKVNDWSALPAWQAAIPITLPSTLRHDPASFSGANESGPAPPLAANSCESVTSPP